MNKGEKVKILIKTLEKHYGTSPLKKRNFSRVVVRTILSQNTNDNLRDRAYHNLIGKFKTLEAIYKAPVKHIEREIKVCGLAKQKAKAIKNYLHWAFTRYGSFEPRKICRESKEELLKDLMSVKGVGEKTAKVALVMGCGIDVFPVDTHIHRILQRLGIVKRGASREKSHRVMEKLCPPQKVYNLHLNMIKLGREICRARNPLCKKCFIFTLCLSRGEW